MTRAIDLVGRVFGRLTVVRFVESRIDRGGHARRIYMCRCECGTEKEQPSGHLRPEAAYAAIAPLAPDTMRDLNCDLDDLDEARVA